MRITDRYQSLMGRTGASAARSAEKTDSSGGPRHAAKRPAQQGVLAVNVSERAQELASANASRLEELRNLVRDGKYHVNAQAIAARLVGEDDGQ